MADIDVMLTPQDNTWVSHVTVREDGTETRHRVTLRRTDYERLTGGRISPEDLLRASFEFLLRKEPKESILREFDLPVISRYFPDYEAWLQEQMT